MGQLANASSLRITKISTQIPHYYFCHNKAIEASYFSEISFPISIIPPLI